MVLTMGSTSTGPSKVPRPFKIPDCSTLEEFRESGLVSQSLPVTAEDRIHNIDLQPEYWYERIREINRIALPSG